MCAVQCYYASHFVVDVTDDPYLMSETNLSACNAVDSSLWEIKTLQAHAIPEIAYAAKFIDRDLPKTEWDISQDLELTMEDVISIFYRIIITYYFQT